MRFWTDRRWAKAVRRIASSFVALLIAAIVVAGCSTAATRQVKVTEAEARFAPGEFAATPTAPVPGSIGIPEKGPMFGHGGNARPDGGNNPLATLMGGRGGRSGGGGGEKEKLVPYNDILRYPGDWPDVRARAGYLAAASVSPPIDELWVIQKDGASPPAPANDDLPRTGALMAKRAPNDTPEQMVPVPLKHTDVKASIAGYIATVDVTQQFHNPYAEKIEAVYVFPLPANAAVNEFVMTIGDRKIRGIIRERRGGRADLRRGPQARGTSRRC